MDEPSPIDREALRRMRQIISTAIATRRCTIGEAAAEARGLAQGLHPALPAPVIEAAVVAILVELRAHQPPPEPVEVDGYQLRPATPEEVAEASAYAMRFDERGKARWTDLNFASKPAADQLVRHQELSGFVMMRKPPAMPHGSR